MAGWAIITEGKIVRWGTSFCFRDLFWEPPAHLLLQRSILRNPLLIFPLRSMQSQSSSLCQTQVKLPIWKRLMYKQIKQRKLLTLDIPKKADSMASMVETQFNYMRQSPILNKATSSAYLFDIMGKFITHLNDEAQPSRCLVNLTCVRACVLDSANPTGLVYESCWSAEQGDFVPRALSNLI